MRPTPLIPSERKTPKEARGRATPRAVAIGLWHDSEPLGPPLQVVLSPGGPHALSSPEDSFP